MQDDLDDGEWEPVSPSESRAIWFLIVSLSLCLAFIVARIGGWL